MIEGILGKKLGMTQVFAADGRWIPVTVVEAGPCTVLQKKTAASDGYDALQLGFGAVKSHRVNKPLMGHFRKAGQGAFAKLAEIRQRIDLPVGVGFGIKDAETAGRLARMADAVIVGSAIVGRMEALAMKPAQIPAAIGDFLAGLRVAIDAADRA